MKPKIAESSEKNLAALLYGFTYYLRQWLALHTAYWCHTQWLQKWYIPITFPETHDSFFAVLIGKRPSYECFLEKCSKEFWTHEERRDHGVKAHQFPLDFKFDEARREAEAAAANDGVQPMEMEQEEEEEEEPGNLLIYNIIINK